MNASAHKVLQLFLLPLERETLEYQSHGQCPVHLITSVKSCTLEFDY